MIFECCCTRERAALTTWNTSEDFPCSHIHFYIIIFDSGYLLGPYIIIITIIIVIVHVIYIAFFLVLKALKLRVSVLLLNLLLSRTFAV